MFDQIIDEVHTLLYLKEVRSAQQLFSHLLERIPEARSLPVGALKRAAATTAEVTVAASDSELVLAPAEFDFEPRSNAVAYLTSLVRAAAILELIPQFLSIVTQRVVSELYQITERELQQTAKQYHSDASSQPFRFRSGTEDGVGESPLFVPVLRGNMDRVDSNEFDAFVPHLRRLCGRTLGPYLVVANCIRTIGETVQQIVDASGTNKLDVHAFYRNCLSAIHGEVKNWLSCMLHGSKTTSRIFTNSTVAITEALKDKKDSQSRGNGRAPLYQFINVAEGSRVLAGILEPTAVLSAKDEEAARKLASMLVVDPFATGKQDSGHRSIVKPNLQYLAILYRPFAQLDGWLERLFPQDHEEAGPFIDASFVEGVLSEEYLPAIENYAMQELTRAFNGTDALLWHALTEPDAALAIGRGANSLLHCVSSFIGLLCQVTCVLHQIPGSQAECEQLMISLMNSFLDRCEAKFRDLVTNKAASDEGAAPTFVAVSSTFVAHEALRQLLQQHSMLTGAEDETLDGILARKESFLLEKLKSDRSLHRNEIIFDYRILRSIALMQRSLELLPQILGDSTFGSVPSFPLFRPEFRSNETGRLVSNFFDGTARGVIPLSGDFDSRYNGFLLTVRKLSETCLFTLRTELRVHCFYFLDLAHREGNYALEEEAGDEPDAYVSSLAGDLIRFEALVTDWLPFSRYHVVVDELDESLVGMLLADFRYIRALNAAGCHKLQTNVSTLEQILALISAGSTAGMEPARQFYRLAAAGPEKLIELAPHCEHKFALQHYQAIFDVYYRDSSGDAGLQRTHNNQLVRLKYLLEGGNDSTTGKT
jgi:exocyst complex component 4